MKKLSIYISLLFVLTCAKEDSQAPNTVPSQIIKQYTLTASAVDGGSVTGGGTFASGTQVSLTATPTSGYSFSGWSNGSTANPLTVTLNSNTTITASFQVIINSYTLTVSSGEGGSVSTEGGEYQEGTEVTITATPEEGYGFIGWNGSDSSSSTISVTLAANTTIEAIFRLFPQFTLPETPSKMFTKGVGDTLSIGFSHAGGYKTTSLSAEYGNVSVISEPNEGDTEGNIVIEYTVNTVENVDIIKTIAGTDNIEISFTGADDLVAISEYQVRTQPEPIYKDYLKPSHDLAETRIRIDIGYVRYLNQRDNYWVNYCNGVYTNYNQYEQNAFIVEGIGFADVNGDGYDDIFTHPTYGSYVDNSLFSSLELDFELYLYVNGEYVHTEIDWGGRSPLKKHLSRKILVGDFDNDGDPDFYAANFGIDRPPYPGEYGTFIINNYNLDGSFDYKDNTLSMGSHEASSGDLDGDGLLDLFSFSQTNENFGNNQWRRKSKFFKNEGNFNLSYWDDIIVNINDGLWDYISTYHSEIVDVDKDGNLDLITIGHEWDRFSSNCDRWSSNGNCGVGKIFWGDYEGKFDYNRVSLIPTVQNFGTPTDIDIVDINGDGINEIIISRTGGDINSFPNGDYTDGVDVNTNIGVSNYYGGHYIQINTLDENRFITDLSNSLISDNSNSNPSNICTTPEDRWLYWTNVYDYDGNGLIDIFNTLNAEVVLHRWEWNGSKFIKKPYTNPFGY